LAKSRESAADALQHSWQNHNKKIKPMFFHTPTPLFPRLAGLPLAGKAMTVTRATPARHRSPTLSRRELRRLIADMVD